jgi:hypothetical protein
MFLGKYQGSVSVAGEVVSPAEGIRISKSSIHNTGKLKITLLDTKGKERASIITEIQ